MTGTYKPCFPVVEHMVLLGFLKKREKELQEKGAIIAGATGIVYPLLLRNVEENN
jgi:hypothetical protein